LSIVIVAKHIVIVTINHESKHPPGLLILVIFVGAVGKGRNPIDGGDFGGDLLFFLLVFLTKLS